MVLPSLQGTEKIQCVSLVSGEYAEFSDRSPGGWLHIVQIHTESVCTLGGLAAAVFEFHFQFEISVANFVEF